MGAFPGDSLGKNLLANAFDPWSGIKLGFDPWSWKILHAEGQQRPCATILSLRPKALELQLLQPMQPAAHAPKQEKPRQ